jgi:hypothetical protein
MIPPSLMYQMAQDRQAELLRETEEYRRAGLTVRMRIRARIPRFHTGSRRSRAGVVGSSTPGLVKINLLKRAPGCGKSHDRPSIQSALVSTLEVSDAGPNQLLNEYDTETNAGGDPKQAKAMRSKGSPTR